MSAPGVVVEESGWVNVSVRKSLTVPVFIGVYYGDLGVVLPQTTGCLRVDDPIALRRLCPNSELFTVNIAAGKATIVPPSSNKNASAIAIQHYFENGGGPCYILPVEGGHNMGYSHFISETEDISLIASALDFTGLPQAIPKEIKPLLDKDVGYFYLGNANKKDEPLEKPDVPKGKCAIYHPYLTVQYRPWRDDCSIAVTGHTDPTVITLDLLKEKSPDLYASADAQIKELLAAQQTCVVPPGPAVAAAYCRTDRERGVWKAPANILITGATPYIFFSKAEQASQNDDGINIIRTINNQTTIYGARTTELDLPEWRYVSVRRLSNQVQRDVTRALKAYVGQPNTYATWIKARGAIESYLYNIWQLGGLQGTRPEDGYRVTVDDGLVHDDTAIPPGTEDGKLVATIELAPSRPAEFISLQFTQDLN